MMKTLLATLAIVFSLAGWMRGDVLIVADEIPAMEVLAKNLKDAESIPSRIVTQTNLPPALAPFSAVVVYIHKGLAAAAERAFIDYTEGGGKLIVREDDRPEAIRVRMEAYEKSTSPLADYYRQRGVALFQLGNKHDDEARTSFAQSEHQMRKLGEGESEAQALMTGTRHINLLGKPDWDGALRVMEMVENTFPSDSLEASMTRHWAAACGLLTGDGRIRQRGQELLAVNQQTAARFGHQATVSKLLYLTPELGLSRGLEAIWVRKALYQNAFRLK